MRTPKPRIPGNTQRFFDALRALEYLRDHPGEFYTRETLQSTLGLTTDIALLFSTLTLMGCVEVNGRRPTAYSFIKMTTGAKISAFAHHRSQENAARRFAKKAALNEQEKQQRAAARAARAAESPLLPPDPPLLPAPLSIVAPAPKPAVGVILARYSRSEGKAHEFVLTIPLDQSGVLDLYEQLQQQLTRFTNPV